VEAINAASDAAAITNILADLNALGLGTFTAAGLNISIRSSSNFGTLAGAQGVATAGTAFSLSPVIS
jgi:hypothetical protein